MRDRPAAERALNAGLSGYSDYGISILKRSAYREENAEVLKALVGARKERRITQLELAAGLGAPQSFVSRYENGGRHLDVVEFLRIAHVLRANPHDLIDEIVKAAPSLRARSRKRPTAR